MATLISDIFADADAWEVHSPNYAQALVLVGGASNRASAPSANIICNLSSRSPVLLACVAAGQPDKIHVLHSPTRYVADPLNASNYDGEVVCLCGNNLNTSFQVVLATDNAFGRPNANTLCFNIATITGAGVSEAETSAQALTTLETQTLTL